MDSLLQEDFHMAGETLLVSPPGDSLVVYEQKLDPITEKFMPLEEGVFCFQINRQQEIVRTAMSWDEFMAHYETYLSQGYARMDRATIFSQMAIVSPLTPSVRLSFF